ncbi:MAG: M48 family metallopeptidase [Pontixanthobacter sp.]
MAGLLIAPALAHVPGNEFATSFKTLQARDTLLQNIGWRLQRGNAPFCDKTQFSLGLLIDDALSYPDAAARRSIDGLQGDFSVQAVAMGSPAHLAGIEPGMELTAINGAPLSDRPFDADRPWARATYVHDRLTPNVEKAALRAITLVMTDGPTTMQPVKTCRSRLEVATGGKDAVADGTRIVLNRDFAGFSYPEDEFAAIVAHELAHNFLGHRGYLDARGRTRSDIRATEREADRLMPWLLANGGYPPEAASRFMRRWGPDHSGGLRLGKKHDGWRKRLALIEAELPYVAASIAQHGHADWKRNFRSQFTRN